MTLLQKDNSPFYPGQPVPVELFVGRTEQLERVLTRGAAQVARGKPVAMFIQGEYGIGKSSIARFLQYLCREHHNLHPIYASLGGSKSMDDVAARVLEATIRSGAFDPSRNERIRNWLSKYIGEQSFGGVTLHVEALRKDAPSVATGMLPFLAEVYARLKDTGTRGVFLVMDEINGIAGNPQFAHLIKGIVDANAMQQERLPLFLMLCGVEERRWEMITQHQPVDRIFDVIDIAAMSDLEMRDFFTKAYASVQMTVDDSAMKILCKYSAGFPKIMHMIGDTAFWMDKDGKVDEDDAARAVVAAAEEVGKKYFDQQVYKALRSADYHSILQKIARMGPDAMTFKKVDVAAGLTDSESKKFDNFLQRMKRLKVLRSGDVQGEYLFSMRMVRLYIWLQSLSAKSDD